MYVLTHICVYLHMHIYVCIVQTYVYDSIRLYCTYSCVFVCIVHIIGIVHIGLYTHVYAYIVCMSFIGLYMCVLLVSICIYCIGMT
jgi:hypothetical protein